MDIVDFSAKWQTKLHRSFCDAFSDYDIRFSPSLENFQTRIFEKLNIDPGLSPLAIENDRVLGFLMHTSGCYQKKRTIYNGGTGVVPSSRKQKIATNLFISVYEKVKNSDFDRLLLEVLETNTSGLNLYEKLGFTYSRSYKCFKKTDQTSLENDHSNIKLLQQDKWKPEKYVAFRDYESSFIDSDGQLVHNLQNEQIFEAYHEDKLVGHVVFQPKIGRISQLSVDPLFRNRGIGKALVNKCLANSGSNGLTLLNVPEDESETIVALERMGFSNQVNQIELELLL